MGAEWRISVICPARSTARKAEGVLRDRAGDDFEVSADANRVYLYAETAEGAKNAARAARDAIVEEHMNAPLAVQYWDPASQAWTDAATGVPAEDGGPPEFTVLETLRFNGLLRGSVLDIIGGQF